MYIQSVLHITDTLKCILNECLVPNDIAGFPVEPYFYSALINSCGE